VAFYIIEIEGLLKTLNGDKPLKHVPRKEKIVNRPLPIHPEQSVKRISTIYV